MTNPNPPNTPSNDKDHKFKPIGFGANVCSKCGDTYESHLPTKPDISEDEQIIDIVKSITMFAFQRGNWQKPIELHELIKYTTGIKALISSKETEARLEENELGLSKLKGSSAQQALDIRHHFGDRISKLTGGQIDES